MRSDLLGLLAIAAMAIAIFSSGQGLCAEDSVPPRKAETIKDCHDEGDKLKRADCYDRVTERRVAEPIEAKTDAPPPESSTTTESNSGGRMTGYLAQRWGYDREPKETRFDLRLYENNYLIARSSSSPNSSPYKPGPDGTPEYGTVPIDLEHPELKFQLSLKARVLDFSLKPDGAKEEIKDAIGLWLAYSQQSQWQAFNNTQSSPFRESNYQPEAIVSIHPQLFGEDRADFDWHWRVFNVGFGHQSNGQDSPLSRSWNYLFAQLGFEHDRPDSQWAFVVRPWYRIPESRTTDDNRDLIDYYGYGDIRATYHGCKVTASLTLRGNPRTGKGAAQLDASFPFWPFSEDPLYPLQWYVQVFTGYGESLIDYNWRQTTAGIGVRVNDRPPAPPGCSRKSG